MILAYCEKNVHNLKYTVEIILQVRQKTVKYNKYSSGLNGAVDRKIFQILSSGRQYYKHKVEVPLTFP